MVSYEHLIAAAASAGLLCAVAVVHRLVAAAPAAVSHDWLNVERPVWMRIVWGVVRVIAFHVGPRLGIHRRQRLLEHLRCAEADHLVTPQEWVAVRIVLVVTVGIGVSLAMSGTRLPVVVTALGGGALGFAIAGRWLARRRAHVEFSVMRELPMYLDVLTLAVEAGMSLTAAIGCCVDKSVDSPLRRALLRALREIRAGRTRSDAFAMLDQRLQIASITSLTTALSNAERSGASVGQVLRAQAEQRNAERFSRAEKLAMEAPVKMLGPLILCIFPCTFIILAFPIAMQLSRQFGP